VLSPSQALGLYGRVILVVHTYDAPIPRPICPVVDTQGAGVRGKFQADLRPPPIKISLIKTFQNKILELRVTTFTYQTCAMNVLTSAGWLCIANRSFELTGSMRTRLKEAIVSTSRFCKVCLLLSAVTGFKKSFFA